MTEIQKTINKKNSEIKTAFKESLKKTEKINKELLNMQDELAKYLYLLSSKIIYFAKLEQNLDSYLTDSSLKELQIDNQSRYIELLDSNYDKSYANPEHSSKIFGNELGSIYSFVYSKIRDCSSFCFQHKIYKIHELSELFINLYNSRNSSLKEIQDHVTNLYSKNEVDSLKIVFLEYYGQRNEFNKNVIEEADLSDERYIYSYGEYISENEKGLVRFFKEYPQEKIELLAKEMCAAYLRGLEEKRNDSPEFLKRKVIAIDYYIGQEKIVKALILELKKKGFNGLLAHAHTTPPNKQYSYDYKFDNALYFNNNFAETRITAIKKVHQEIKEVLQLHSGPIYFDSFGEKPFTPVQKDSCLKLDNSQQKTMMAFQSKVRKISEQYVPEAEGSFSIIAFPTPEIGTEFEKIFSETLDINMLSSDKYHKIQKNIIDVLDRAEAVHIKGNNNNRTDIIVKHWPIKNLENETNYCNCGADVNIPVGEVFTTPMLKGTTGTLHVSEIYLNGLKYVDLELNFKDGYVTTYSCKNFDSSKEGKKFIHDNLFLPHKTLPMGEFAIGTNTQAYAMAKKFNILSIMPILIVEKMGPHFAIGDTCYSYEEDQKTYNPIDNKQIMAKDNEHSIRRKEDHLDAYTSSHTDITLPYEELKFISAISTDGTIVDIIRDGKFQISGTEELNIPLENIEK